MRLAWLMADWLGLPRYLWLTLACAAAVIVHGLLMLREQADDAANQAIGRQLEQINSMAVSLDKVEQAAETRKVIDREMDLGRGAALHAECLRAAREPANCARFLPLEPALDD